jgi:hypothetical protein
LVAHTSVILATWEAEIGKTMVQGQPRKIIWETPHLQNNQSKMDWRCGSNGRASANPSPTKSKINK